MPGYELPEEACPTSRSDNGYVDACRPFEYFGEYNLESCHEFLDSEGYYHQADTSYWDKAGNDLNGFFKQVKSLMSLECSSNLVSFVCNTFFRPCVEVTDASGESTWAPSLTCESDCEAFTTVWDECIVDIGADTTKKANFDDAMRQLGTEQHEAMSTLAAFSKRDFPPAIPEEGMHQLAPFRCDVTGGEMGDIQAEDWYKAFMLGRLPSKHADGVPVYSHDFPEGMSKKRLYPEESSLFTLPNDRGEVEVPCSSRSSTLAKARDCPEPFLKPTEDGIDSCVHPCPVPAFSDAEYDLMWGFAVIPGVMGFFLNGFMAATWVVGGAVFMRKTPLALRSCAVVGLLYNLVETFPVLFLKTDLACGDCGTNECTGETKLCAINRSSPYLLMAILLNLMTLLLTLFADLGQRRKLSKFVKEKGTGLAVLIPFLLMLLGYAIEGNDNGSANEVLNTARHSFTCSMRFENMFVEWVLVWMHFVWQCNIITMLVIYIARRISKTMSSVKSSAASSSGSNEMQKSQRRLVQMAAMIAILCVIQMVTNIWTSQTLDSWTEASNLDLKCQFEEYRFRKWDAYGFTEGQKICEAADVTWSRSPCTDACYYFPPAEDNTEFSETDLKCSADVSLFGGEAEEDGLGRSSGGIDCDCPCSKMVKQEAPPVSVLCLSYFAQSFIVCIVGISLGFKNENIKVWRKKIGIPDEKSQQSTRASSRKASSVQSSVLSEVQSEVKK